MVSTSGTRAMPPAPEIIRIRCCDTCGEDIWHPDDLAYGTCTVCVAERLARTQARLVTQRRAGLVTCPMCEGRRRVERMEPKYIGLSSGGHAVYSDHLVRACYTCPSCEGDGTVSPHRVATLHTEVAD